MYRVEYFSNGKIFNNTYTTLELASSMYSSACARPSQVARLYGPNRELLALYVDDDVAEDCRILESLEKATMESAAADMQNAHDKIKRAEGYARQRLDLMRKYADRKGGAA